MIIYEVTNTKLGTHHYVAEIISQAEINIYNRNGLSPLLTGTTIPVHMIKTILVDKLDDKVVTKELIYERAKPYVIEAPGETIAQIFLTPGTFKPTIIPKVKKIETPSADNRTTEEIRDDLEKKYRDFILLLHRSEMELSSIRRTVEDALHQIQDQKILEKFHK